MLKNLICVSTWQTSGSRSGQWKLFVKFRKRNKLASSANAVLWDRIKPKVNSLEDASEGEASWESMEDDDLASSEAALLKELDDIYHNPESDCSILHVQTASYSRVPPSIGGMRLVDVCKTMTGSAFQYQRLRLNFVPSHFGFSHCDSLQSVVVDDIVGMKVYQWFHPNYEMSESYTWPK